MTGKVLGVTFVIFAVLTAAVLHAQAEIARDVRLPTRYWIEWGGQFGTTSISSSSSTGAHQET